MRNPKTFLKPPSSVVEHKRCRAEVQLEQIAIHPLDALDGERLARFGQRVRDLFKFREHRLANDRAADGVDLPIDEKRPLFVARGALAIMCRASSCSLNVLATSATKIV